jgi:hypothetical protein
MAEKHFRNRLNSNLCGGVGHLPHLIENTIPSGQQNFGGPILIVTELIHTYGPLPVRLGTVSLGQKAKTFLTQLLVTRQSHRVFSIRPSSAR